MGQYIENYKGLTVWQRAMELAKECYLITKTFPKEEVYGLTAQIRRASVSIPANIAEGWGRENRGEFIYFLRIAQGSLKELETHLLLSEQVNLLSKKLLLPRLSQLDEVGKMLRGLIRKLQEKTQKSSQRE